MNFSNEEQAKEAIEAWREDPPKAQLMKIGNAMESLDLNEMYYEQKGSDKALERVGKIRAILEKRREELSAG